MLTVCSSSVPKSYQRCDIVAANVTVTKSRPLTGSACNKGGLKQ